MGNRLSNVSQLFRRAFKVAYSFGSGGGGQHWVFLKAMQGTTVGRGLPPSAVFTVTPAMQNSFMQKFSTLGGSMGPSGGATGGGITAGVPDSGGISGGGSSAPSSSFLGLNQPGTGSIIPLDSTIAGNQTGVVTPPVVAPTAEAPPPPPPPPPPAPSPAPAPTSNLPPFPPR